MPGQRITEDQDFEQIFKSARRIAVVGASPKAERPSNRILRYLLEQGYQVIPVNPAGGVIEGQAVARHLEDIQGGVDIVDVFRNPKELDLGLVDTAVQLGAKVLWLQDGVIREDIADKAVQAGLQVVMDDCIYRRHANVGFCAI
jgi:hypothetical protein